MSTLTIYLHIPPVVALQNGSAQAGDIELALTDNQAKEIRDRDLVETAAVYVSVSVPQVRQQRLMVTDASWEAILFALHNRDVVLSAERRHQEDLDKARTAQQAAIAEIDRHKRRVIVLRGRRDQLERFDAGVLPEEEVLALVREVAFKPLAELPRYKRLACTDADHDVDCEIDGDGHGGIDDSNVTYDSIPLAVLTAGQWDTCKAFQELVDDVPELWSQVISYDKTTDPVGLGKIRVEAKEHVVTCDTCGKSTRRPSVMVAIEWAGYILTREYAL